jgi:hypothetical protein
MKNGKNSGFGGLGGSRTAEGDVALIVNRNIEFNG